MASNRELLALNHFLKRFHFSLKSTQFDIITDTQVLKPFFNKPRLGKREARLIETLGVFGILSITMKP